ncbi:MAG: AAA family ATPase [Dysgonamonadaceae bacterium]|jgi:MoxR-like ATPase|nr:AAA family ATPase [Dysgonamonadaceae bacterium]
MEVNNIELDNNNTAFNQAVEFIRFTNKNLFLTGKAGTGKTTFLKHIRQTIDKKMVVLAPTGVAAINANGQTVHSFFHIGRSIYTPDDTRLRRKAPDNESDQRTIADFFHFRQNQMQLIKSLELLIIDEVSMLRCDLVDVVDKVLRWVRDCENEPFGGVQVLLIGDAFQLPPIASNEEWKILETFYDSPFFFHSHVIQDNPPVYLELKTIYRQKERQFVDLLNHIRMNTVNESDNMLLHSRYLPDFQHEESITYITLATHNRIVDDINRNKLAQLPAEEKIFEAKITGVFPEEIMPTNQILHLKTGAQIMFVKNRFPMYYNGLMGKITQITPEGLLVETKLGVIPVSIEEWGNIRYSWNRMKNRVEEEIIGTFQQYPVRLAWAITVHKSQGLTFDHVIADVGAAFTHGQVYVALSRCTNLEGLILRSKIDKHAIKTNPQALLYSRNEISEEQLAKILQTAKAEYNTPQTMATQLSAEPNMTIDELFEKMNEYFNNTDLSFTMLSSKLNVLLVNNTTIFATNIKNLEWTNEEKVILLLFFHLLINNHIEWVKLSDIEELFDSKILFREVQLLMLQEEHQAFKYGYIKTILSPSDTGLPSLPRSQSRSQKQYCLTTKAITTFIPGVLPEKKEKQAANNITEKYIPDFNNIIDYRNIIRKALFYNQQEREQINSLSKLLDRERFPEIQQRLIAAGMKKGFACIFYGAPGTGKTETVYQIAKETNRNIYMVDISETKSMWVGESEKQVKKIFDSYREYSKNSEITPILLFNEADAVISRRVNVQQSADSAMNAMQNIVLQEMENLEGIMIATTNLTENLDKAFERRFLYKIEFRKPTAETRKEIWQALIPALNPEEAKELAEAYDFSGGEIENISRKYTVENILYGDILSFADLHRFCQTEKLDNNRHIGFT